MPKLTVPLSAVNRDCHGVIVGKEPIFDYRDGKKVSDNPIGTKLLIALQNMRLSPLTVRFDHDPLPNITDEQIATATASCKFMFVELPDCMVSLYPNSSNGIGMTATAQTAKLVSIKQ